MSEIYVCPICGAMGSLSLGAPHGWRQPCPYSSIPAATSALLEIDAYIKELAYPGPETNWIAGIARTALGGQSTGVTT